MTSVNATAPLFAGPPGEWPSPAGLLFGFACVGVGQIVVLAYYIVRRFGMKSKTIQIRSPPDATLAADLYDHVTNPESFLMVFGYLSGVWMLRLLPDAYYDTESALVWWHVPLQFVVVDVFTTASHLLEHNWPALYKRSHKMHHRFTNPKLYNAFNGSPLDTFSLILVPLFLTHQVCFMVNTNGLAAFGTLYAAQFTLIHCEYRHPWDSVCEFLGIGTAEDHNIHHLLFKYNYGHFFMWWDWLLGTYRAPHTIKKFRSFFEFQEALLREKGDQAEIDPEYLERKEQWEQILRNEQQDKVKAN